MVNSMILQKNKYNHDKDLKKKAGGTFGEAMMSSTNPNKKSFHVKDYWNFLTSKITQVAILITWFQLEIHEK